MHINQASKMGWATVAFRGISFEALCLLAPYFIFLGEPDVVLCTVVEEESPTCPYLLSLTAPEEIKPQTRQGPSETVQVNGICQIMGILQGRG